MAGFRRPEERAGPALEHLAVLSFTDPVAPGPGDRESLQERMEALYGPFADLSWLTGGALVSYHHMARTAVRELGARLAGVDLVITVDASPDCRHQSFPGPVLAHLLPGDPIMLGVSEQGVAGPFTALRIARQYLDSGTAHRALILVLEQSTLPPDDAAVRPARDVAVALLLGPDGTVRLDAPTVTVTRTAAADPTATDTDVTGAGVDVTGTDVDVLVAGVGVTDLPAGVPVRRAEPGHPCAGVWLALGALLAERPDGGRVQVVERDPVLPYRCGVTLTAYPAGRSTRRPGRRHRTRELVR